MKDKLPYESGFELICDQCGFFQEFQVGNDWKLFIEEAKAEGWQFRKYKHCIWENYCPGCTEKYRKTIITKEVK